MAANQGIVTPIHAYTTGEVVYPIDTFARNMYINETPLLSRLPRVPIGADKFKMGARTVRGRTRSLGAALADNTNTTVNVNNVSDLQIGDVLQLASGERVEVTADPSISNTTTGAGTVTVRRGIESTTAAAQNNGTSVTLLYNSRTGAEVDQTAQRSFPSYTDQYVQTFQFPVQIGGKTNAMTAMSLPPGVNSLFSQERMARLTEMVRDIEYAIYFSVGEYNATGSRSKMVGLYTLINGAGNAVTNPTNASAYKAVDFLRDTVEACLADGGNPDLLVVSTNFLTGFATWGHAAQQVNAGGTVFGTPIRLLEVPFLNHPVLCVPSIQLPNYTAICLSTRDAQGMPTVRLRHIRQESWLPRASRGDAIEGDWIADFAIEVDNAAHHAWVQGITAFSA
jgi:hypothetical protein